MDTNEQNQTAYRQRRERGLRSAGFTLHEDHLRQLKAQSELLGHARPGLYVWELVKQDAERRGFQFGNADNTDDQEDHT